MLNIVRTSVCRSSINFDALLSPWNETPHAVYEEEMRLAAAVAVLVLTACSNAGSTTATSHAVPSPVAIKIPVPGSVVSAPGCGTTPIYQGGELPDWATDNAPQIQYVVTAPAIALGYLFSYPLKAGLGANTKILWYVSTPRNGYSLEASGRPLGASTPTATFSRAADSFPGEIYPTGPTVPAPGCWEFTLTWDTGAQHADVNLLFKS
jgi:hypothetical protein